MMKTAVVFAGIVLVSFFVIFMLTKQNTTSTPTATNFLTPTPTPSPSLEIPTAVPTVPKIDMISANSATIKTPKGNIELVLYATEAAKTVTNFATLSKRGFYNNLTFHRVETWVIQGGDPKGNGGGGYSIYGETFKDEINPNSDLYKAGYVEGILAMAKTQAAPPGTGGSQFFIMKKNLALQPLYTIFGKVTSGMEVVQSIVAGDKILGIDVK